MCLIVFIIQVFQLRLVWICNEPSEPIEQPFRDEKTLYKYKTSRAKVGISWMGFAARKRKHTKYHDGSCTTSPEAIIGKLHKLCNYYFGAPALKQVMFNHRFPIQNHPYTWKKSWCLPFFLGIFLKASPIFQPHGPIWKSASEHHFGRGPRHHAPGRSRDSWTPRQRSRMRLRLSWQPQEKHEESSGNFLTIWLWLR